MRWGVHFGSQTKIDFHFADVLDAGEAVVYLLEDEAAGGALRRGEGHGDLDPLARPCRRGVGIGAGCDGVDQAQVDEVQLDFGIEAVAERGEDVGFGEHEFQLQL